MTHPEHDFDGARPGSSRQHFVEQRNDCGRAFERKALRPRITSMQDILEHFGSDQTCKNSLRVDMRRFLFDPLLDPAPLVGVWNMHELCADRAAVEASS